MPTTRAQTAKRLAEDSIDNNAFAVVYNAHTLAALLLAYTDAAGHILPCDDANVRRLFDEREVWKLGTIFRSFWSMIQVRQATSLAELGWTADQMDAHNLSPRPPGLDLPVLLFHDSPAALHTDAHERARVLEQLFWRQDLAVPLWEVCHQDAFLAYQASITGCTLVENDEIGRASCRERV